LSLRDLSIRRQLSLATLGASGLALLFASAAFVAYDRVSFKDGLVRRLSGEADIVGSNSATALLFDDARAATQTLAGLRVEPHVDSAAIYDAKGILFASYVRPGKAGADPPPLLPAAPGSTGHAFEANRLVLTRPLVFDRQTVGRVYLQADLDELRERLLRHGGIVLLVFLGSLGVAFLVELQAQRAIADPLLRLADTARRVSEEKDFRVRAAAPGRNEIGRLVRTFNDMLEGLQGRDAELQRRLEERTALLVGAEEANRLKDQFLATLSHELRTPLQSILAWAAALRNGGLSDEVAARGLATILRNADAQRRLIDDLLDTSRIVSGGLRLELEDVDLAAMLDAMVESFRPAAEAKGVKLHVKLDRAIGLIQGDTGRLQQLASNLLSNAIKFTPAGGQVEVTLERADSHAVLRFADTGVGMARDFLPHAFDRFRQADASSTRRHGGLGLGLAIVKQIAELHGGSVSARSDGEGTGATLEVKLPLATKGPTSS
jgi:signal transduction histidine kinase